MILLDLPHIALDKILSYLNYDEVAKLRIVSKQFDNACKQRLNKGFVMAERYHGQCLKAVKLQLPRRESERRSHPLSRHNEVLTAIETRLSMLSMTYVKFIDLGLCCFIPGKVIDEIFKILHYTRNSKSLPRSLEVLQELRDISSMAMEHFDEKILPFLREKICQTAEAAPGLLSNTTPSISKVANQIKQNKTDMDKLKDVNKKLISKLKRQQKQLTRQQKQLVLQGTRMQELDTQVIELKRTMEELQHRCGDVTAEISRAREEPATAIELPCNRKRKKCAIDVESSEGSKVPRK